MRTPEQIIEHFSENFLKHFKNEITFSYKKRIFTFSSKKQEMILAVFSKTPCELYTLSDPFITDLSFIKNYIATDHLVTREKQVFSMIRSKLQLNKKIFARKCEVKKVNPIFANLFLDNHHLMAHAKSATYLGLFFNEELIAIAAFSKGRKMNRLQAHQRSFELVRLCYRDGITVTGGLSKLLQHFITEKDPGDIMTYVDKQLSEGTSYLKCGFKLHSETRKQQFLVDAHTFERTNYKGEKFDPKKFYMTENLGNLKLVYTIDKN